MEYFGTSTTEHGHYRWTLTENGMQKNWQKFNDLPFHPESLTNNLQKGETIFYQGGGFTVIAIAGSCKDDRPGTKSVFWVKENLRKGELIKMIMESESAMKIIRAIPFEIKWGLSEHVGQPTVIDAMPIFEKFVIEDERVNGRQTEFVQDHAGGSDKYFSWSVINRWFKRQ